MAKTETHNKLIYDLLLKGQSLTNADALYNHRIGRLASRICDLRNIYNVPIEGDREQNSDGDGYHVRYRMRADVRSRLQGVPLKEVHTIYG